MLAQYRKVVKWSAKASLEQKEQELVELRAAYEKSMVDFAEERKKWDEGRTDLISRNEALKLDMERLRRQQTMDIVT